jgi:hypothetical protein
LVNAVDAKIKSVLLMQAKGGKVVLLTNTLEVHLLKKLIADFITYT